MGRDGYIYEWTPWPGARASVFGPCSYGWQWELIDCRQRVAEGVAPSRFAAFDSITEYARGCVPRDDLIVAAAKVRPVDADGP